MPNSVKRDRTDSTTQNSYHLACNDCRFERIVDGDISDLFDVIEAHQEEYQIAGERHIVNTELKE